MEIYNGLDTLMSVKGLTSNEAFQAYYDQVLSSRENEALNISGFETWDVPQIDFTYEQLEIENDIKVMATYVDLNSEAIPVGSKLGSVLRGSIPRQKARFIIGENDYRKQMMVLERINTPQGLRVQMLPRPPKPQYQESCSEASQTFRMLISAR